MGARAARAIRFIVTVGVLTFVAIQFVPFGRDHTNPPVTQEPRWDSERTRKLAVRACFSCHSNETEWPWYSNVAPMSWFLELDVREGRAALNFSEWDREQKEAEDAAETVLEGEMPPLRYELVHPSARLSDEDKRALARGLAETMGSD